MASVPEMIEQWRNQQLSGTALMRGLVSYKGWRIPISEAAVGEALATNSGPSLQLNTSKDGKTCLFLFSRDEALKTFRNANADTGTIHYLTVSGAWGFHVNVGQVDQLWID